jgi:hypothetical protein
MTMAANGFLYLGAVPVATAIRTNAGEATSAVIATGPKKAYREWVPRPTLSSICFIWGTRRTLALRRAREHRRRQP